jgi:hypothetical protein
MMTVAGVEPGRKEDGGTSLGREEKRETWYDDDSIFYWMERDEEKDLEPLTYLGTFFPNGCRFCM